MAFLPLGQPNVDSQRHTDEMLSCRKRSPKAMMLLVEAPPPVTREARSEREGPMLEAARLSRPPFIIRVGTEASFSLMVLLLRLLARNS